MDGSLTHAEELGDSSLLDCSSPALCFQCDEVHRLEGIAVGKELLGKSQEFCLVVVPFLGGQ